MMSCFGGLTRSVGVMCYLESVNGRASERDERDGAAEKEGGGKRCTHARPRALLLTRGSFPLP